MCTPTSLHQAHRANSQPNSKKRRQDGQIFGKGAIHTAGCRADLPMAERPMSSHFGFTCHKISPPINCKVRWFIEPWSNPREFQIKSCIEVRVELLLVLAICYAPNHSAKLFYETCNWASSIFREMHRETPLDKRLTKREFVDKFTWHRPGTTTTKRIPFYFGSWVMRKVPQYH